MDTDYLTAENTETTEILASNVFSTNLSCKVSFIESFVIVHKVNYVAIIFNLAEIVYLTVPTGRDKLRAGKSKIMTNAILIANVSLSP
jgi:hypothetical protein